MHNRNNPFRVVAAGTACFLAAAAAQAEQVGCVSRWDA